jgi:hypothetical protein
VPGSPRAALGDTSVASRSRVIWDT